MNPSETLDIPLFDRHALLAVAGSCAPQYRSADPFPHIMLENVLAEPVLREVCRLIPSPDADLPWRRVEARFEDGQKAQARKLGMAKELEVAPLVRRVFWELNSGPFLEFLSALTGIRGLVPDPTLQGSGIHQTMSGGVLAVHADFTWHKVYRLKRRINLLIYLNDDWHDDYGGHLQLWSRDMAECRRRIRPGFGRCVIFSTSANSWHGHPEPVQAPAGVTRKSIAMYYYTLHREESGVEDTVATIWKKSPQHGIPAVE